MDFFQIKERTVKSGLIEIYPDFMVTRSKDLMTRGKAFYAIWDEEAQLWSTDEYDVQRLVDKALDEYKAKIESNADGLVKVKYMRNFSTNSWAQFRSYLAHISDTSHQLDESLTFANTVARKKDYVSKRLPYSLEEGPFEAYDELIGTLYDESERAKLEWAIGAIISGDAKDIQKFIVLYGDAGGGKSTILNIVQQLFDGYFVTFDAKALTSSNNAFSTEVFRSNPLVAIQHDGDLSRIEDNTKLNSIVSHELMTMNEKYKPSYTARTNCFLFMASNKPVKISDSKSGVIRRLIDVRTSGRKIPTKRYHQLVSRIPFELGAIASHCLSVYKKMGKNYYSTYKPIDMMFQTDVFFNFVDSVKEIFLESGGVTLSQAYQMYKEYCEDSLVEHRLARYKFRDELRNYFEEFEEVARVDSKQVRSYFRGLKLSRFESNTKPEEEKPSWLTLDQTESIFDKLAEDYPAQYAGSSGVPLTKWENCSTKLRDLDTRKLHYVRLPENHIVIDFDLRDSNGEKSAILNLEAASKWPPTYAENSKSEKGIHLHYLYEGDVSKLAYLFSDGIEVKISNGLAALRRKLTKCNNLEIASIKSGLPLKEEKKVINFQTVKSEQTLRSLILRNLHKEIHPATKPSIDFIYKLLDEAYKSGMHYDVTDLRNKVFAFALSSTNNSTYCAELVTKMQFKSEEPSLSDEDYQDERLVFFDVEVYPNLLLIVWKYQGSSEPVVMINPKPSDIEGLLKFKLVGFNCRRYDNHILYARYIGYDISKIYQISRNIVGSTSDNGLFAEAYRLSYADVYDYSSKKQSLKKFQIELGIRHKELNYPWDEPLDETHWEEAIDYCKNDVISLEAVFEDRKEDFVARQILAELSGLTVNDTTQMHTAKIIFGDDKHPQSKFVYTDLSTIFPGYKFDSGVSFYRGENPGEGGYVYAEPGVYTNVALLDIASMHPTSIVLLNLFGPYTERYEEIKNARLAIKAKRFDEARSMLGGVLSKYLDKEEDGAALAYALKIVINIVYGLTSASFDNKFRDPRNKDNIVAKLGALFMIDLKYALQERGWKVIHCKTDSVKIAEASQEAIDFVFEFGKKYGYTFEHEATYGKIALVNDAVYIAKYEGGKKDGQWVAVGAQFAHPYVFKTLFSKEAIVFDDLCELKSTTSALYLDTGDSKRFIGKTGIFCPMKPETGGGTLLRQQGDKFQAVSGTKGYFWLESEIVRELGKEDDIDLSYFEKLANTSREAIAKYTDFRWFVDPNNVPW